MAVTHVVMFQFKPGVKPESVQELCERMLALKEQCIHPETESSYLKSCVGGKDISVQGIQKGMSHLFVVEFNSIADRDYYALHDPVHLEFVKWSESVTSNVQALDFTHGRF
ncbi:hypothetical protein N7510_009942 [Penicillium lagena]|uniref:uncharacterized protein n=1 Tax=Penicillium lagena TaxID=94218 RepID=UPI002541DB6A|nr:uncharacterized protein N7510_009942 [Penicillium lagena]KAJ5604788.1 hypothetical protein N7510_009942 [Penicillium lagena]